MHEQARKVYHSLRGRDQERFLATFAHLNGDAAARAIEPGYRLTAVAVGVRGALCAGKAPNTTQAISKLSREETRDGGFARAGGRNQTIAHRGEGAEITCVDLDQARKMHAR